MLFYENLKKIKFKFIMYVKSMYSTEQLFLLFRGFSKKNTTKTKINFFKEKSIKKKYTLSGFSC